MKKLPKLVDATRMLVCAEDLGMVPSCVAWVMNELRILSLEIQVCLRTHTYALDIWELTLTEVSAPFQHTTWQHFANGGMKIGHVHRTTSTRCCIVKVLHHTHCQAGWHVTSLADTSPHQVCFVSLAYRTG